MYYKSWVSWRERFVCVSVCVNNDECVSSSAVTYRRSLEDCCFCRCSLVHKRTQANHLNPIHILRVLHRKVAHTDLQVCRKRERERHELQRMIFQWEWGKWKRRWDKWNNKRWRRPPMRETQWKRRRKREKKEGENELTFTIFSSERSWAVTFAVFTHGISCTRIVTFAGVFRCTLHKGITRWTRWTSTWKWAGSVRADSRVATFTIWPERWWTFIDIGATFTWITSVPRFTGASEWTESISAGSSLTTLTEWTVATWAFIDIFTVAERITGETSWTVAVMRTRNICTDRTLTTQTRWTVASVTLVDIDTTSCNVIWIKGETLITHTRCFGCFVHLTVWMSATGDTVTRRSTASKCITDVTFIAQTWVTAFWVNTLSIHSTRQGTTDAFVDIFTLATWITWVNFFVSLFAFTFVTTLWVGAFCICTTNVLRSATFINVYFLPKLHGSRKKKRKKKDRKKINSLDLWEREKLYNWMLLFSFLFSISLFNKQFLFFAVFFAYGSEASEYRKDETRRREKEQGNLFTGERLKKRKRNEMASVSLNCQR